MSEQATFPVGARVRLNGWCSWYGREGVVRDPPFGHHGYPDMRYVLWEDNTYRWHDVDSLECADTPAPDPPRDTDSAERSERVGGDQEQFPVGARVRERRSPARVGTVHRVSDPDEPQVTWDDGGGGYCMAEELERIDPPEPPRAPARTLAPGVERSADTCDGKPRLAGTRTPTDVVRGWHGWDIFHAAHPHVTRPEYDRALLFEAGVAWERGRRRRRKERRAVRRWLRAKALAEGGKDGTTEGR